MWKKKERIFLVRVLCVPLNSLNSCKCTRTAGHIKTQARHYYDKQTTRQSNFRKKKLRFFFYKMRFWATQFEVLINFEKNSRKIFQNKMEICSFNVLLWIFIFFSIANINDVTVNIWLGSHRLRWEHFDCVRVLGWDLFYGGINGITEMWISVAFSRDF